MIKFNIVIIDYYYQIKLIVLSDIILFYKKISAKTLKNFISYANIIIKMYISTLELLQISKMLINIIDLEKINAIKKSCGKRHSFFYDALLILVNKFCESFSSTYFLSTTNFLRFVPGRLNISSLSVASTNERKPRAPNLYSIDLSTM